MQVGIVKPCHDIICRKVECILACRCVPVDRNSEIVHLATNKPDGFALDKSIILAVNGNVQHTLAGRYGLRNNYGTPHIIIYKRGYDIRFCTLFHSHLACLQVNC